MSGNLQVKMFVSSEDAFSHCLPLSHRLRYGTVTRTPGGMMDENHSL